LAAVSCWGCRTWRSWFTSGRELAKSIFDLMNTRMYGRSPSAEMAKVVEKELGNQRKRKIREQNSYGLDQVRDGVSLGKDEVNNPIVDYEQIMRLPNLNFYVRLPGEYPVVRLKLKYRAPKKRQAGLSSAISAMRSVRSWRRLFRRTSAQRLPQV
jgi:type IV secretory pathway TraG/TraD family ATPase VirD4